MGTVLNFWRMLPIIIRAPILGMLIVAIGSAVSVPVILGNLSYRPDLPWAPFATGLMLTLFWLYASGRGGPASTRDARRLATRVDESTSISVTRFFMVLIGVLVSALSLRALTPSIMHMAPPSPLGLDLSTVPLLTQAGLVISISLTAGVTEEVAFRGYIQRPLEDKYGIVFAIVVAGLMFWAAHLNFSAFTLAQLPYLMLVSVWMGCLVYITRSLIPAIIIHTVTDIVNFPIVMSEKPEFFWTLLRAKPVWEEGMTTEFLVVLAVFTISFLFTARVFLALKRAVT